MDPTKFFSSKQEKLVAAELGWDVVTGSGARDCHPGDIISDAWLGECKTHTTSGKPIKFDASVWKKISDEAQSKFKYPVLFVDDGSQSIETTWCLFPCKLVSAPGSKMVELDISVRRNLSFNHAKMAKTYKANQQELGVALVILSVKLFGTTLGLVPLNIFKEMFGE